jgi:flagellar biosynthesis protein
MSESRYNKSAALTYSGEGAPRLVAKGEGELAERIKATAQEFGVPVVEEAGLVQMLCQIPLGDEIPPALYVAVAEVLAHIFRINNRVDELS